MAIQNRRGIYGDFDSDKMLPGEIAVTTDGTRKVYAAFAAGDVKELVAAEDVDEYIGKYVLDETLTDSTKAAPANLVGELKTQVDNVQAAAEEIVGKVEQIQKNTDDISELHGNLDNLNDCIFNGKSPSVDTTSSTEDGVFYSCTTGSKETFPSLYTGYAKVESGKYYIIQVYVIGTLDRNLFSFWNNGNLINMGAYENYEVIDETNRIIKVKAPQNATEIRYTNYISDKATGFCKSEIDKINIRWLSISKDNLDDDLKKDNIAFADFSIDGYINGEGTFVSESFAKVTDYTELNSKKLYISLYSNDLATDIVAQKIGLLTFFDDKRKLISVVYETNITGMYKAEISAPSNAVYYRACKWNGHDDESYCYENVSLIEVSNKVNKTKESVKSLLATKPLYPDSLRKPFDFNGKSAAVFGDSISKGVSSPDLVIVDSYIKRFADFVGLSLDNKAISGNWLTNDGSDRTQYPIITSYTTQKDYLFVALGTNDFNSDKELGIFGSTDSSDFYGALHGICEYFKNNHSNSTIIFITPIPYTEAYWERNQTKAGNHLGYTLNDYRNAIYEVATSYEYNVVDGSTLGMPTGKGGWNNLMCDDTDGCHPTVEGHKLYARNLATKLC